MMHIALLALALALGGGAPRLLDGVSAVWVGHGREVGGHADPNGMTKAGTMAYPNGAPASDAGNILDPDGASAASDAGTILDPDGESADAGTILDPNG